MDVFEHNLGGSETNPGTAFGQHASSCAVADDVFDRFTRLAATLFDVPIAAISLVGEQTVRFRSRVGIEVREVRRSGFFCSAAISRKSVVVVSDLTDDPAMMATDAATHLGFRFYAGTPLIDARGTIIGVFMIADTTPRHDFTAAKQTTLIELARAVVGETELLERLAEKRALTAQLSFRQTLVDLAARAPTLGAALDDLMRHAGRWLGATYLVISEAELGSATFRVVAIYAASEPLDRVLCREYLASWRPLTELSCPEVFTEQIIVDSGPITSAEQVSAYPGFVQAVAHGTSRQISIPITLDSRHFALAAGFDDADLPADRIATCTNLASWLTTVLRGRLREEALSRANAQLERANRALQTLLAANEAIAHATDEAVLTRTICERAIEIGRYAAAWVGLAEADDAATLRPVAVAGQGIERIGEVHISWADNEFGRGPSGTAVREGRPVVIHDIMSDDRIQPWRSSTGYTGHTSAIALPLRDEAGRSFGCLTLLAGDRASADHAADASFDVEEIRVLSQLAADLAFGIGAIRTRLARDAAQARQRTSEQHFTRLLDASPTVIYAVEQPAGCQSPDGWRLVDISANLQRLYGHDPVDAHAPGWWRAHVHPDDLDIVLADERRLLTEGRLVQHYRFARQDGTYRWLRDEKTLIPGPPGGADRIIGTLADVTDHHTADEEIHRLAFYDTLTGLPNRAMLHQAVRSALVPPGPNERACRRAGALIFIDLKHFVRINDLHGHAIGDHVLEEVARRFTAATRRKDIVARLGGDKFAVLLTDLAETPQSAAEIAERIAGKLLLSLAQPIHLAGHECHLAADAGITLLGPGPASADDLFREADIAVHQAKRAERTPVVFFQPAMQEQVNRRYATEVALREALDQDRLELWLQSQVDRHGTILGAEALVRLRLADGALMPPDAFIPIAEATGMIFKLGRLVFAMVGRILAEHRAAGRPLRIAVNVSAPQFHDPGFVGDIEHMLAVTGADPHDIVLEITESTLIDCGTTTVAKLERLADLGLSFSVDDFGVGYSSLAYLQNLPISELKIDRSFVTRLPHNPRDAALAEAILALTHHLGLSAVAEGVETEAQAEFLRARHCQTMQGFLFGHPEPAAQWLASWQCARKVFEPASAS
jgi:diguanylate cyclase (GGDEF)-like protein/PAS domain S-box-containing protein